MFLISRHLSRVWKGSPTTMQPGYTMVLLQRSVTDGTSDDSKRPGAPRHARQKDEKKVKNTVKSKNEDAHTLIKKVSESLHHPKLDGQKQHRNTQNKIKQRLKLIVAETNLRKVDGCTAPKDRPHRGDFEGGTYGGKKSYEGITRKFQDQGFTYDNSKYVLKETFDDQPRKFHGRGLRRDDMKVGGTKSFDNHFVPPAATHLSDKSVIDSYIKILLENEERLGLFDALGNVQESMKEKMPTTEEETDLEARTEGKTAIEWWDEYEAEAIKKASHKQAKSSYEEMLDWMNDGTLPEFPINNEIGMEHEVDVPFHKHVFLHQQIDEGFPKRGPVRQFMEAVILGLSKNAYLTLEEKADHINWFREYFNEKYELLKTLGAVREDSKLEAGKS